MNKYRVFEVVLIAVLLSAYSNTFGQKADNAANDVWKKRVTRIIDLSQKEDTIVHHLRDENQSKGLFEMLMNSIKAGKLTAYANYDVNFTAVLPYGKLEVALYPIDTITLVDPITNTEVQKIIKKSFDLESMHKYRVLEEWAFNTHTGKTEIQITGIAPIQDVYGDDGSYRGRKALFWVRYSDARDIIAKYNQYYPANTLEGHIWDDYFLSDVKPEGVK